MNIPDISTVDAVTYTLGGSGIITLIIFMIRKSWQQIMGTSVDSAKATADAVIYNNLKEEVGRISTELREIKTEHKKEKAAFEHRIVELETKVMRMSYHLGNVRRLALDIYAKLLKIPPDIEGALEDIQIIIKED